MRKILSLLFCLTMGACLYAQERPVWLDYSFEETKKSYLQVVVDSSFKSREYAKEDALLQVLKDNVMNTNAKVEVVGEMMFLKGEEESAVKARVIDEYYEMKNYQHIAYLLIQVAKDPSYKFDNVTISDKHPFSARVFLPGMSQIYKGQTAKGVCFIAGEIVFVGGAIISHSMMKTNMNKINSTHNSSLKYQYTQNANTWMSIRNVSIAGAVAVYLWNVIDGIAAKGEEAVFLGMNNVSVSPYTDFNSTGVALNFKF